MEQPTDRVITSEEMSSETVGRRQLLKALAATGGVVAASLLPVKWSKPVVEAGELSAHAQASPVPPQPDPTYVALCDSTPGGGNLVNTPTITNIRPYIELFSGSGPLEGIQATMTVDVISSTSPTFGYSFPQYSTTDSTGRASFPDLDVSGQDGQSFWLIFEFAVPNGTATARCGIFYYQAPQP